ncbi:hypothetical protein LCGC14_2018410 [marine sediment metagenome]|uniref:Uncharacterized protein n=1 Tax=marine sediment metagenome TaxID=412755 RepID=A0A0F9HVD6_9ZZZZ
MNQYDYDIIRERTKMRILYFLIFGIMYLVTFISQVEGKFVLLLITGSVLVLLTMRQVKDCKDYKKDRQYLLWISMKRKI